MKYNGIIFDCDGTLVLTEHINAESIQEILAIYDINLNTLEIRKKYSGQSILTTIQQIQEEYNLIIPNFFEKFREISKNKKINGLETTKGTIQAIKTITELEINYAIASNSPHNVIKESIKSIQDINLSDELIISAYDYNKFKPDPYIFKHASKKLLIPENKLLIIEDSISGIKAALQTDSTPIIILNGDNDHMKDAFPEVKKIEDMQEILNYIN